MSHNRDAQPRVYAHLIHQIADEEIFSETRSLAKGKCLEGVLYTSVHQPLGDVFSDELPTLALSSDVVVVLEFMRQLLDFRFGEASLLEHLFGLLLPPNCAEASPS